ncbi:MAG: patatin-like phospholipase family protein [Chitinophagales bacterium]|nr:patatin-like phospholipase family protein [Chitinophagales bacterium]
MGKEKSTKKTTVSLVLGSGGARGLAHIGVIKWLEAHNFEIKSISGCSIGSLIGGVYAAGKLDKLEAWMVSLKKSDVTALLDISWGHGGFFKGERVINTMIEFLEDIQIEELPIPYTAIATDIATEKEVWINSGSLFAAIRASCSLPLFFTPIKSGNAILIDGGVLNPVPIAPTFNDNTDLTIAVNLGGAIIEEELREEKEVETQNSDADIQEKLKKFLESFNSKNEKPTTKIWTMTDVASKAFETMQNSIARMKLASYPPDLEIEIARNACGTLDFHRSAEMIELGYRKAQQAYDILNK